MHFCLQCICTIYTYPCRRRSYLTIVTQHFMVYGVWILFTLLLKCIFLFVVSTKWTDFFSILALLYYFFCVFFFIVSKVKNKKTIHLFLTGTMISSWYFFLLFKFLQRRFSSSFELCLWIIVLRTELLGIVKKNIQRKWSEI